MHEPPSTPSGASLASIQAASTLYSSSLANRLNNSADLPLTRHLTAFQEQMPASHVSASSIYTAEQLPGQPHQMQMYKATTCPCHVISMDAQTEGSCVHACFLAQCSVKTPAMLGGLM